MVSFRLHGTPAQVTGVQISYMLPLALLGPLSGVFVDRWPLKPTLVSSDLIRAGLVRAAVLLLVDVAHLRHSRRAQLRVELLRPGAVGDDSQPRATGRAAVGQRADAAGDDGGARDRAGRGRRSWSRRSAPTICYALDFVSFLGVGGADRIGRHHPPRRADPRPVSANSRVHAMFHDMGEGIRFIFHHAALFFVVMAMAAGMFMMGCFGPLIAVYVREWLHARPACSGSSARWSALA